MDYKSFFDIPDDVIYLNTAGNGLLPRQHIAWRQQRELEFFDPRSALRDQQPEFIRSTKVAACQLFNCPLENTYAIPNFSFGFNTLLNGLPSNFKYLLLVDDYPSVYYPVISRQLMHRTVTPDAHLEERIESMVRSERPDVLVLSVVDYITGLKVDLDFIKQLKEQFPDLLIVGDATQYLGTEPFDFSTSGFDAVGASGYKWLLAGFGNGLLFLSNSMKENLYVEAQAGVRPKEAMWANKSILDTFFEPGHRDTLSHGTLGQSMLFFENLGLANIQRHLQGLASYAYEKLTERNFLLPEISQRTVRSTLINVQVDPGMYPLLLQEGIQCFPRGSGLRIALHLYNDHKDIDRFLTIIDRYL